MKSSNQSGTSSQSHIDFLWNDRNAMARERQKKKCENQNKSVSVNFNEPKRRFQRHAIHIKQISNENRVIARSLLAHSSTIRIFWCVYVFCDAALFSVEKNFVAHSILSLARVRELSSLVVAAGNRSFGHLKNSYFSKIKWNGGRWDWARGRTRHSNVYGHVVAMPAMNTNERR